MISLPFLHYHYGGYFFILFAGAFSHHYATAYFLHYKTLLQIYAIAYTKLHELLYYHVEVNFIMTVKDAVAKRFEQLCDQRGIRPNELATRAGVTPSTVYSMLNPSRQRVSIATIKKLCDGLDITLGQFFSCALFDELEQEIQ